MDYTKPVIAGGHFTWGEYAYLPSFKDYAKPTAAQKLNAITLFRYIEELIRKPLGKPLIISSGARTAEYTLYLRRKRIPAAIHSAHNDWAAVDLKAPEGMTNEQFWKWCSIRWPGRMENLSSTPTWVHLDTRQWGDRVRFNP